MINYKHLYYFWMVAKEGGIARAGQRLHLTPQTISGQLTVLEGNIGQALFSKAGRNLEMTETGRQVLSYADEIFSLGGELEELLRNLPGERSLQFKVGIVDVVPKSIACRLLTPALQLPESIRLNCREGGIEALLADLAVHKVDLVISDGPIPHGIDVRGFNHPLGDSGTTFFATRKLARSLTKKFPENLDGAPILLPGVTTTMRSQLTQWFDERRIHPRVIGEFDDSALTKAFGQEGIGVFTAPSAISQEVEKQYGVVSIGETDKVRAQFFAISVERKISHPAVVAITENAREWLFRDGMHKRKQNKKKSDDTNHV